MSEKQIKKIIKDVSHSFEVEGLQVSDTCIKLAEKFLNNEITTEQCINEIKAKYGVA